MFTDSSISFQEVIPGLYIGSQSALQSPYPLIAKKITHLLAVNNFKEKLLGFTMKTMNIEDSEDADILSCFQECINFIKSAKRILVFCAAGRSRSAAVVAAYLIKEKQMTLSEALITINRVRAVRPNEGFIRQLVDWERLSGCRVCRTLSEAHRILQEEDFSVVTCTGCQFPMAILRDHSARRTADLANLVKEAVLEVANKYCNGPCEIRPCTTAHAAWHISFEGLACCFINQAS
jgi:atypical dual specificity phosphatase